MSSKNNRNGERAMTLIEVMIAMALLLIMATTMQKIIANNLDAMGRMERRNEVLHQGRSAMRRLVMDLANAFAVAPTQAMVGAADGSNPVIETRFFGESRGGRDQLTFAAFSHFRYIRNVRESDQSTIVYNVKSDPDNSENLQLLRKEVASIDVGSSSKGTSFPIVDHVKSFTLKYLDTKSSEWRSDWDSKDPTRANRIPRAVRIEMELTDPNEKDEVLKFSTIALVQLWQAPIEF